MCGRKSVSTKKILERDRETDRNRDTEKGTENHDWNNPVLMATDKIHQPKTPLNLCYTKV